jgi:hypothetical protein
MQKELALSDDRGKALIEKELMENHKLATCVEVY